MINLSSQPRTAFSLYMTDPVMAETVEELLWTIDGVESITWQMQPRPDAVEPLQALYVIGFGLILYDAVRAVLDHHGLLAAMTLGQPETIREEDWAESWKRFWHAHRVLPHLLIVPSWETIQAAPEDVVLHLDPGSAFGTGTHETTQLMLSLLEEATRKEPLPRTLLDVGTGSGILALYGAKQGIVEVMALDNDPLAVSVGRENARRNGVSTTIQFTDAPLNSLDSLHFDVIAANILAPTLCEMMPDLSRLLAPSGRLLLSGITTGQYPRMHTAMADAGLKPVKILQKGPWLAIMGHSA
jgi:ribosomal protein L11 methyltransferase